MTGRVEYELVDEPEQFRLAAEKLAHGRGPFAVDTERASSFRYGNRAFLVQISRRGAGTFLVAPEGHRAKTEAMFAPVLNGQDWIIHAASEDLLSLAQLGLYPGRLFDTELASRIAGFARPNLAAMVQYFLGMELEKGHGHEDWSRTPLPTSWQDYAALDVLFLHDLAEALAEHLDIAGKLGYAEQEFDYLIHKYALSAPPERTWREVKGVSAVRSSSGLQVAKELWRARDAIGQETDTSPGRVLSNRAIVDIARAEPASAAELSAAVHERLPGKRARQWQQVVEDALATDRSTWPTRHSPAAEAVPPARSTWERHYPHSWTVLQVSRTGITDLASALTMQPEVLLTPSTLREVAWEAPSSGPAWDTDLAARRLSSAGARPWQVSLTAPIVARAHAEALTAYPARPKPGGGQGSGGSRSSSRRRKRD